MSDVVRDAIATELALTTRVTTTPAGPFGYGADISCTTDLAEDMREVDGIEALAQALLRRQDCPRGMLADDLGYGISLTEYLNEGTTAQDLQTLGSKIRGELRKDDRVDAVLVIVDPSPDGTILRIRETITPVDPRLGPFSMTLAVTSAGVVLEAMERGA
jgi:hypothetical protein